MIGKPVRAGCKTTGSARSGWGLAALACALALAGCGDNAPIEASRYLEPDGLYGQLLAGADAAPTLSYQVDIDHSRLAGEAGVAMPPAHLLMVSQPRLEAMMVAQHQLLGLELPLRALAYEDTNGEAAVLHNRWDNIAARHEVVAPELAEHFDGAMNELLHKVPAQRLRTVPASPDSQDGIVTLNSVHDFETTVTRAREAIDAQGDTVWFGEVDLQAIAADLEIVVRPTRLLLFGGPEPGGRAMAAAPELGLDGFCQKLLIWQGDDGRTRVSFNDLLVLAERQAAPSSMALRVINFRLNSTFEQVAAKD